jgi:Ca-activated chloride channel family protein
MVPLRHIDYHLQIVNSLLSVTLTQKYFNPLEQFLEVDFALPIVPESSIYKFEAQFGDVTLKGVVKEKKEAKEEFTKAKEEGRQTVLGTIDPNSKDILNFQIGNIPPRTELTVTVSMLQELQISLNTFYRLLIPSTISPRYINVVPDAQTQIS